MKLCLGTAQFGLDYGISNDLGKISVSEIRAILQLAHSKKIEMIDTAISYGDSEKLIGNLGQNYTTWKVITKIPAINLGDNIEKICRQYVHGSLGRLKVKELYGVLLHEPNQLMEPEGERILFALRELKSEGYINKVGVSLYANEKSLEILNKYQFDIVQWPINIFDRTLISSGLAESLKERDVEIHARSVFLQGLLLLKPDHLPRKFLNWYDSFASYHSWLNEFKLTPIQACLGVISS